MRKSKAKPPVPVSIDGHSFPSLGAWAKASTVKPSTLSKLLARGSEPRRSTAVKLAGAIGVSTERLYRWLHEERTTA